MFIANEWKDYEVIDCSAGEKLERWGDYLLVRPDPQVIWDTKKEHRGWKKMNGHYHRSAKGGGEWEFFDLPQQWSIDYELPSGKKLTFNLKPFSFKHTGLFPEQAANWSWFSEKIRNAGRPIKVLNLFAYTGGATLAAAAAGASVAHVDASQGMVAWAKENNEIYKVELIEDLPEGEVISFYKQGDFTDLCRGPHLPSTKKVKAVKLLSVAGAYWRGDEKNKMLQRIYGISFEKNKDLEEYLHMLEEAKKRDHRKLGRELDLFFIPEEGPGFPLFLPKGMELKNELLKFWREIHREDGYQEIETPIILNQKLWETSGHWYNYKENMYTVDIDEQQFAIKPMNCPGSLIYYNAKPHSYKEFPMKVAELGRVHRHELSGALHGLMRVRAFTQDDAHIFMLPEQIKDQIKGVVDLIDRVYKTFGFEYHLELSTRPENSIGSDEEWEAAENGLREALEELNLPYILNEGDGAFYGPKIDFHLRDCLGRTWQCGTIQLDMQLPQRFDITYIGQDGEKHRPVMIHRVAFGSIERFIGILIEHYAGKFPVWLAPTQVRILPISDKYNDYANEVKKALFDRGIRVEIDDRAEKTGFKIREAQLQKIPYMLIVGEKEAADKTVSVRSRDNGEVGSISLDEFITTISEEVESRKNVIQD